MNRNRSRLLALVVVAGIAVGCGDTNVYPSNVGVVTPVSPSPVGTVPGVTRSTIEFRVTGTLTSARIDYTDPTNGLTEVVTGLPYVADVFTTQGEIFLSLQVTPMAYSFAASAPFVSAQIFVNGVLFRGAVAQDGSFNTLAVNGTWRAN